MTEHEVGAIITANDGPYTISALTESSKSWVTREIKAASVEEIARTIDLLLNVSVAVSLNSGNRMIGLWNKIPLREIFPF